MQVRIGIGRFLKRKSHKDLPPKPSTQPQAATFVGHSTINPVRSIAVQVTCSPLTPPDILPPMSTLVECVPNFSEGRDKSKVDAIVEAMKMDGVYCSIARWIPTIIAASLRWWEPEAIQEAAIRGVGKAAEILDLTKHQGAHPRLGAADVVPFIPIEGVTLEDCVAMARHAGAEIWKRYQVPVYLYEAAATIPERQNLEYIRRGQFEGIARKLPPIPHVSLTSEMRNCIPQRAQSWWAHAKRLSLTTSFSIPLTLKLRKKWPRQCDFPAADCVS